MPPPIEYATADRLAVVLQLYAQSERPCVVIELIISHHGSEVDKWLPAVRQNSHESGSQIEVIADRHLVLKGEFGRIGS